MARRATRKPIGKRDDDQTLKSIEKVLLVIQSHMQTQIIERADGAERFEARVKEDDERAAKMFDKIDKIEDRLAPIDAAVGRVPVIEREVWKLVELRNQAEGVQIFVGKVARVSGAVWAVVGSAVTAAGVWIWTHWPFK